MASDPVQQTTPRRIQRRRAAGWRMPEGAVYVGRPTKWGNPFVAGQHGTTDYCADLFNHLMMGRAAVVGAPSLRELEAARSRIVCDIAELRGHDLACWCAVGKPCHADVLLQLANA